MTVEQPLSEILAERFPGHPRFFELIEKMVRTHASKNHDYAGGDDYFRNFYACEEWGGDPFIGVMHRMTDKWSRLCTLIREGRITNPSVADEPLTDTYLDLANYLLIAQIILERVMQDREPIPAASDLRGERIDELGYAMLVIDWLGLDGRERQ